MPILVVGSEGVIGSRLVEKLGELGLPCWRCDHKKKKAQNYIMADITRYETLEKAFETARPDVVFHLAGEVSRETCEHWPALAIETNVLGTLNIASLCIRFGAKLVYAGSSEEYGTSCDERVVDEETPFGKPRGVYGLSKRVAEEVIEHWHRTRGLSATVVRIFMCYGREFPTGYRSAISEFIMRARRNETIYVHKGTQRAWCYIDDIVDGLIKASRYRLGYDPYLEVFLMGRDEPVDTLRVAEMIVSILNSKSEVKLVPAPNGITPIKRATFDKAKRLLGWDAGIPLEVGLRKEIEWALKNIPS